MTQLSRRQRLALATGAVLISALAACGGEGSNSTARPSTAPGATATTATAVPTSTTVPPVTATASTIPPTTTPVPSTIPGTRTLQFTILVDPANPYGCGSSDALPVTITDDHMPIASGLIPALPGTGKCQLTGLIPNIPYS